MKKIAVLFALLLLGVTSFAQIVNIHKTSGEVLKYKVSSVRFVERMDTIKVKGIDFGLPSGLLWADRNVGAEDFLDYGKYFTWGDTVGHALDENYNFSRANYKWTDDEGDFTKYCTNDNKNRLDLEDDPAHVALGGDWRMPTFEDFMELLQSATGVWSLKNGVECLRLRANNGGGEIFLPATGSFEESECKSVGLAGKYWCSTLSEEVSEASNTFFFLKSKENHLGVVLDFYSTGRWDGLCVRPVCTKKEGVDATACIPVLRRYYIVTRADGTTTEYREEDVSYVEFVESLEPVLLEGHEAIDLGLPSGLMWATMNLGAEHPEDYGLYFQWGDTIGKSKETVNETSWSNYKWSEGAPDQLTKYCTKEKYGVVDNKTVLDLEDDAAHALWKGDWRMPTKDEIKELIDNTTQEWTIVNNVHGMRFTSKTVETSIFLPAAGYGDGVLLNDEDNCLYWSSSLYDKNENRANMLLVGESEDSNVMGIMAYFYRCAGVSVRAVHSK